MKAATKGASSVVDSDERSRASVLLFTTPSSWKVFCRIVKYDGEFDVILENVDEFCQALSSSKGITAIFFGDVEGPATLTKLGINENASACNKLFLSIGNISTVHTLELGGYDLSGHVMARLLRSLPAVMVR